MKATSNFKTCFFVLLFIGVCSVLYGNNSANPSIGKEPAENETVTVEEKQKRRAAAHEEEKRLERERVEFNRTNFESPITMPSTI